MCDVRRGGILENVKYELESASLPTLKFESRVYDSAPCRARLQQDSQCLILYTIPHFYRHMAEVVRHVLGVEMEIAHGMMPTSTPLSISPSPIPIVAEGACG
jgi:hypothetical protein